VTAVISNSSPLIAFRQLNQIDLLFALTGPLLIAPAVQHEVFRDWQPPDWIEVRPIDLSIPALVLTQRLGAGESETIALALELGGGRVLLDDLAARRAAEGYGLSVVGTVGLLYQARLNGLIPALQPALDELLRWNFRLSRTLYRALLQSAGEA
jgi:predicted nucleic acid-binding protein